MASDGGDGRWRGGRGRRAQISREKFRNTVVAQRARKSSIESTRNEKRESGHSCPRKHANEKDGEYVPQLPFF